MAVNPYTQSIMWISTKVAVGYVLWIKNGDLDLELPCNAEYVLEWPWCNLISSQLGRRTQGGKELCPQCLLAFIFGLGHKGFTKFNTH